MSFIDILKSLLRIGCNLRKGGTKVKNKPDKALKGKHKVICTLNLYASTNRI